MEAFTAFATTTGACAYLASATHTGRDLRANETSPLDDRPVTARRAPEQRSPGSTARPSLRPHDAGGLRAAGGIG